MWKILNLFLILSTFCLSSCVIRSYEYRHFYAHLHKYHQVWPCMQEEDYFIIFLVDAPHLDYTQTSRFFQSVAKHPHNGSKNGDVGHAWIYLKGWHQGKPFVLEGGHSGEVEEYPARYFDGIMNYNEWGYANPTEIDKDHPRYEPNPVQYLCEVRKDGFFQKGSGGHRPTFAAKVSLTSEQFQSILKFISQYSYENYDLIDSQCCSFVAKIANLIDLPLIYHFSVPISSCVHFRHSHVRLWTDACYAKMTFASPDVLEKSLIEAVKNHQAQYALSWYLIQKNSDH